MVLCFYVNIHIVIVTLIIHVRTIANTVNGRKKGFTLGNTFTRINICLHNKFPYVAFILSAHPFSELSVKFLSLQIFKSNHPGMK